MKTSDNDGDNAYIGFGGNTDASDADDNQHLQEYSEPNSMSYSQLVNTMSQEVLNTVAENARRNS